MEFRDVVRHRRMWRNFDGRPIPADAIERMLEHAIHAPSAGFSQGWAFMLFSERDELTRFWDLTWPLQNRTGPYTGITSAACVIVPMSNKQIYLDRYAEPDKGWTDLDEDRWPVSYWDIDTAFASMLILLTAVDEGLGALFYGMGNVEEFQSAYGVPPDYTPIGAIAVGYPRQDRPSPSLKRGRRPVDEVVHRGHW